eukprot:7808514-Alexandrium_andersonii.AAC.1
MLNSLLSLRSVALRWRAKRIASRIGRIAGLQLASESNLDESTLRVGAGACGVRVEIASDLRGAARR